MALRLTASVLFGLLAGTVLGFHVLPEEATAHVSLAAGHLRAYSFDRSDCYSGTRKDPVGILFWDKGHRMSNIDVHLMDHTTLDKDNPYSSTQYFGVHNCRPMSEDWVNGGWWPNRYHMRVRMGSMNGAPGTPDVDPVLDKYSLATPHIDTFALVGCTLPNHAVHDGDFDSGRTDITDALRNGGHTVVESNWGNTLKAQQCNGEMSGSLTGQVWYIRISSGDPDIHP